MIPVLISQFSNLFCCRFHVMVHPGVNFNPDKDFVALEGLNFSDNKVRPIFAQWKIYDFHYFKEPWQGLHRMTFMKSARGFSQVVGLLNLPMSRVVGKAVPYKYKIVTPAGRYWEELSLFRGYTTGIVNRILQGRVIHG